MPATTPLPPTLTAGRPGYADCPLGASFSSVAADDRRRASFARVVVQYIECRASATAVVSLLLLFRRHRGSGRVLST